MSVDLETQVRRIIEKMGVEGAGQPVGQPFNPIGDLQSKLGATRMELRDLPPLLILDLLSHRDYCTSKYPSAEIAFNNDSFLDAEERKSGGNCQVCVGSLDPKGEPKMSGTA